MGARRGTGAKVLRRALLPLLLVVGGAACGAGPRFPVDGERAHRRVVFQVEAGSRVPGTSGHRKVRAWIESELARLGAGVETQRFQDSTLGRPEELANVIGRYRASRPGASSG